MLLNASTKKHIFALTHFRIIFIKLYLNIIDFLSNPIYFREIEKRAWSSPDVKGVRSKNVENCLRLRLRAPTPQMSLLEWIVRGRAGIQSSPAGRKDHGWLRGFVFCFWFCFFIASCKRKRQLWEVKELRKVYCWSVLVLNMGSALCQADLLPGSLGFSLCPLGFYFKNISSQHESYKNRMRFMD